MRFWKYLLFAIFLSACGTANTPSNSNGSDGGSCSVSQNNILKMPAWEQYNLMLTEPTCIGRIETIRRKYPSMVDIPVGVNPNTPAVVNDLLYVPNCASNSLSVVKAATRQSNFNDIPVGKCPQTPSVANKLLFVPCSESNNVYVINPNTQNLDEVTEAILPVGAAPVKAVVAEGFVYVPNQGDGTVSVIDSKSLKVVKTIQVGNKPKTPAIFENFVYVPNWSSDGIGKSGGSLSVIDISKQEVSATIELGQSGIYPDTPAVSKKWLYVPDTVVISPAHVSVIDPAQQKVVNTIELDDASYSSNAIVVEPFVYVMTDKGVYVIDTNTQKVTTKIQVGEYPRGAVSDGKLVYVANEGSININSAFSVPGSISIIDPKTQSVIVTLATGTYTMLPAVVSPYLYVPIASQPFYSLSEPGVPDVLTAVYIGQ